METKTINTHLDALDNRSGNAEKWDFYRIAILGVRALCSIADAIRDAKAP